MLVVRFGVPRCVYYYGYALLVIVAANMSDIPAKKKKKQKKLRRHWKPLPKLIKEQEPLWIVKLLHQIKEKIKGDQEGYRLDLKPAPNGSW